MTTGPDVPNDQPMPGENPGSDRVPFRRKPVACLCKKKLSELHTLKPSLGTGLFRPTETVLSPNFDSDKTLEARPVCPYGELDEELRKILVEGSDTLEERVARLGEYLKGHEELRLRETGWIGFRPRSPGSNATAFARTGLGLQGASVLARAMTALNCTIADLDLTDNSLGPNEVSLLSKAIASNRSLLALRMSGNRASVFGGAEVALLLSLNPRIQELELARASIGYHGAESFAKYLGGSHLTSLDLSDNSIGDKGFTAIAQSLSGNYNLQRLDVGGNAITDDGASALAKLLERLSHRSPTEKQLKHLGLQRNKIRAKGASEIANALSLGCGVQVLDLRANFIKDEGANALAEAVKAKKNSVTRIDVDGSHVSAGALAKLDEALKLPKSDGPRGFGKESPVSDRISSKDSRGSLPNRTLVAEILGRPPGTRGHKRVVPGGMLL